MTPPANPPPGGPHDWLRHAESDLHLARLGKDDPDVMRNQLAFHAQQAAEKAIKGVLLRHAVRFPRTHDLEALTELARLAKLSWPFAEDEIDALTPYAVETRYPGGYAEITKLELESAIGVAERVVRWAKELACPTEISFPVQIRDPQLRQACERTVGCVQGCPPDQLPVLALLDAWHWFRLTEGDVSPRAAEAIEHLLSPGLRPALREWYRRFGDDMNENALEFRNRLSRLAGEQFGH